MTNPLAGLADFPDRRELEDLLRSLLPLGWEDAVRTGDDERLQELKATIDNPAIVAALGRAGWVARAHV
jgi:hypothetical protein